MKELTEASKYVLSRARWDEGMRGHFIRMFTLTGPDDIMMMLRKVEAEAIAPYREALDDLVSDIDLGVLDGTAIDDARALLTENEA